MRTYVRYQPPAVGPPLRCLRRAPWAHGRDRRRAGGASIRKFPCRLSDLRRAGAAEGLDGLDDRGRRFLGGAGVEGWVGVVLDPQLDRLGDLGAGLAADQVEGHVEAGGDAGGGDRLAVLDEAAADRVGPELPQALEEEPVRGCPLALQQAGGAEDQRAGADRGRPLGPLVDSPQPGERRLVLGDRLADLSAGTTTMSGSLDSPSSLSTVSPRPPSARTSPRLAPTSSISQPGTQ